MKYLRYKNKIQCMTHWANEYNMNYKTFIGRINKGWTMKKTLSEPVRVYHFTGKIKYKGKINTLVYFARKYNIKRCTLLSRINRGLTIHKALTKPVRKYTTYE